MENKVLSIIEKDSWLEPVSDQINERYCSYKSRLEQIESSSGSIVEYANGYMYYGLHYDPKAKGWWFREWLPAAHDVFIFGDFNDWQRTELRLDKDKSGVWSIFLSDKKYKDRIVHGGLYKMLVNGDNGWLERLPAYVTKTYEDVISHNFSAQIWDIEQDFNWGKDSFKIDPKKPLLIYESHVGMAQEQERVGSFRKFTRDILPRVKMLGYNAVQLMAVAEHPYYGSFGYHVSNFYAPSCRFGTPEELKTLVKTAHDMGIAVIMDIVHSHYVKNINEGINELDGTPYQYSPAGEAGNQIYWDSRNFDYAKPEVEHFLLSNIKYWIDEFHFDGFRFDGVTSMLYYNHGYQEFDSRESFFNDNINRDALRYLALANKLIHELSPSAITIAEDVSGMPGICFPAEEGGVGFDYRLAMAIPDFWIKLLEDVPDEDWDIHQMWSIMNNRLSDVKTIAYAESHDQAMVGDKTIAFRLMDKEMYYNMTLTSQSIVIDRGIALHKMIRLLTITTGGQGYLNFMGNEFGHPEWIDFPREGNGWSYEHARRQWSLSNNKLLRYNFLQAFDKAMIELVTKYKILNESYAYNLLMDNDNKTMVYRHGSLIFVFNFHPSNSIMGYNIPVPVKGKYRLILNSDSKEFGGFERIAEDNEYISVSERSEDGNRHEYMKIYNINRAALVFKKE